MGNFAPFAALSAGQGKKIGTRGSGIRTRCNTNLSDGLLGRLDFVGAALVAAL